MVQIVGDGIGVHHKSNLSKMLGRRTDKSQTSLSERAMQTFRGKYCTNVEVTP